jgi:hypothetical protein
MSDLLDPYPGNLRPIKTDQIPDYTYDRGANIIWLLRTMNNRLHADVEKLKHDRMRYRETISTLKAVLKKHGLWEEAVEAMRVQNNFDPPLDK